jgi:hypothetical protein
LYGLKLAKHESKVGHMIGLTIAYPNGSYVEPIKDPKQRASRRFSVEAVLVRPVPWSYCRDHV